MEWVKVFSSIGEMHEQLPEATPRLFVLNGRSLCLVRWKGKLRAIDNKCPHNGEQLSKGKLNFLGEVVCPWHGYRFHLVTGREGDERCSDVETFPVMENDEGVFVGL